MAEIFDALRILAPIAYQDGRLAVGGDADRVSAALSTLAESTLALERHARTRDPGFAYLAHGLSDRARTASQLVSAGREEDARRVVRGMVDQCVACHTRIPAIHEFQLGEELLRELDETSLSLRQRASLEIATRRFERALATYEQLFASGSVRNAGASDPALVRYLAISLSVRGDRARAVAALTALREHPDVGLELREDLRAWTRSIEDLRDDDRVGPRLTRARALLAQSEALAERSSKSRALVFDLEARLELQHFLAEQSELSTDVAEAYYRMGRIEERIWDRPWISNAAPFFEESIRLAPGEPFARDAYERLERIWLLGYTGSAGTRLPSDVRQRLKELSDEVHRASQPGSRSL